jgi:hypothetical protein
MRYVIFLILVIISVLFAHGASAENDRYRVEVIVLTHLHHAEESREILWLEDFSAALDFLTPPPETEDEEVEEDAAPVAPSEDVTTEPDLVAEENLPVEEEPDPNAVLHIEEMSPVMQEAWRRMRLSAPFRPEQYLSWEQGSEAPFPTLRMHDLEPVMVDDPYFQMRKAMEDAAAELANQPGSGTFEEAGADAEGEQEEDALPEPTYYYRLDGTVKLIRTRFLHFDIDLQLREAVFDEELQRGLLQSAPGAELAAEDLPPPKPSSYLVYDLQQRRQVKTGRMEYFDSPVLGVLAYISRLEPEEPQD